MKFSFYLIVLFWGTCFTNVYGNSLAEGLNVKKMIENFFMMANSKDKLSYKDEEYFFGHMASDIGFATKYTKNFFEKAYFCNLVRHSKIFELPKSKFDRMTFGVVLEKNSTSYMIYKEKLNFNAKLNGDYKKDNHTIMPNIHAANVIVTITEYEKKFPKVKVFNFALLKYEKTYIIDLINSTYGNLFFPEVLGLKNGVVQGTFILPKESFIDESE